MASYPKSVFQHHNWQGYQYLLPSLAAFAVFTLLPIVYTILISFTNYGSSNLYFYSQLWNQYFSPEEYSLSSDRYDYELYAKNPEKTIYDLVLIEEAGSSKSVTNPDQHQTIFLYPDLDLNQSSFLLNDLNSDQVSYPLHGSKVMLRDIILLRSQLKRIRVKLPNGQVLRWINLRQFQAREQRYQKQSKGQILDRKTGEVLTPDFSQGYYKTPQGEKSGPGFIIFIGWKHYQELITDPKIIYPFLKVFGWTIFFALGSVILSFMIGLGLAVILSWQAIQGRSVYRTLLIIPYALPAFISILIFRGFFNPGFGEINILLEGLFHIKPDWFSDPWLARGMVLWVNVWLSYPFMMILCLGYLQAIPSDLHEAAALDGASPWDHFWHIIMPWVLPPLIPLLVTSFAFAFNNVVLILLLTGGGPNQINAATSVGETDILASYTYRLAFGQAEAQYGLAAAIATIIFGIMLGLTGIQNRLTSLMSKGLER